MRLEPGAKPMILPFTLLLLCGLLIAGFLTQTHRGQLSKQWIEKYGFAPHDLWTGQLERLFLSAFLTDRASSFFQAVILSLVMAGATEIFGGTWRAALTFWGIHFATLLLTSLALLPFHHLKIPFAESLSHARDVGPSAGYFGCLGALVFSSSWRWPASGILIVALTVFFFSPPHPDENPHVKIHADSAHLMAFILGCTLSLFWPMKGLP